MKYLNFVMLNWLFDSDTKDVRFAGFLPRPEKLYMTRPGIAVQIGTQNGRANIDSGIIHVQSKGD